MGIKIDLYFVFIIVALFALAAIARAEDIKLQWNAPTESADHTPLTDLSHYLVKQSAVKSQYVRGTGTRVDAPATTLQITSPRSPEYSVVTAVDTSGNESENSNEIQICGSDLSAELAAAQAETKKWAGLFITLQFTTSFWKDFYHTMLDSLNKCQTK